MWRTLALFLLVISVEAAGQADTNYIPGKTYNWKSKVLLARLNGQVTNELERNSITREHPFHKQYLDSHDFLIARVRDSSFLDVGDIQWLLDETYTRLREANPGISNGPKTLLAYRQPFPNAYCVGEGTFLITTGLLSRIENQSQLASMISHEMAHYEMNHFYRRLQLEEAVTAQARKSTDKVTGDPLVDKVRGLQLLAADYFKIFRQWEFEADSLGLLYFIKAGFNQREYITSFAMLDPESVKDEDPLTGFFAPLNFKGYTFQKAWLKPRAGIYGKSKWGFFLSEDATRTHPELLLRVEKLLPMIVEEGQVNFVPDSSIQKVSYASQLESSILSGSELLDLSLHEILIGLKRFPKDRYLVSSMGRLLLKSVDLIRDNTLQYHLPERTMGYDKRMLMTNSFLNNITREELIQLGYHFMRVNFQPYEDHYYLLWKFSQVSERHEAMTKTAEAYLEKFPKGKFVKLMR